MKRIITAFISILLLLVGCGCTEEKQIEKNETILKYYETSEEYFDYESTFFDFRLPNYWKGKYTVDVFADHEDFYEKDSYNENGTGLVFSIYSYGDKSYRKNHKNYKYLCYSEELEKHYVLVYPDEETYIENAQTTYNDMKEAISIVLYTFKV